MGLNFKGDILDLYHIYIYIYNCGCSRTKDEVKELQHWCGNAMGPRRKVTRGEEGMSQSTLRHSKWE